ncbi:MAG: SRPBCC family protein [Acidobacteriota bacterium]
MDFKRALGAEFRAVREVDHGGQPARAVEGTRFYLTEPEDLWHALTDPERLPRWFLPITGELRLGGRFQLEGHAGGTIKRCDPPRLLEVTWEYGGNVSWVELRLAPEKGGARLTLVHTMLKDEESEAHWATYGPGATGVGWDLALFGLGLHLESGNSGAGGAESVRKASDAWLASEAGKTFIRARADEWGSAHVAGGENAEVAAAMAAQTAKFYTGE